MNNTTLGLTLCCRRMDEKAQMLDSAAARATKLKEESEQATKDYARAREEYAIARTALLEALKDTP